MTDPVPELITILILGPMTPTADVDGNVVQPARTAQLTQFVRTIVEDLVRQYPTLGPVAVDTPDVIAASTIIPGVLTKIEGADVALLDLSGNSQNVMYELGLVNALGMPFILTTSGDNPPFYMRNINCVTNLQQLDRFISTNEKHSALRDRIELFLRSVRGSNDNPDDFAANPITEYFRGLPVVDISAPAGLAAGYWRNAVRRFVRVGGYFDRPDAQVAFPELQTGTPDQLLIRHFVAVQPISFLDETPEADDRRLASTLADIGYRTTNGIISKESALDMRVFGGNFLCRLRPDDSFELVLPGIVIDIPSTLYALQYSPRVMRIGRAQLGRLHGRASLDQLRRRRYSDMLDRFNGIMDYYLDQDDARGHASQVHFVTLDELPALLATLVPSA
jgi:hypothetical protein